MLNRSFKPAKCKTSLKLATSRLKLMKNKKLEQINRMKRELSQLLETGQDRTARIRVEHVIREEKMVAAYDLIEIYCELIVARLPIIESQKSCPLDLKEAVTSVIYASPRCSDIPELQDARKHFTTKYGKVFISAAIDLVPNCGVGRMLIEKLSVVAPDVQTKIKVLSAVAEEYNIKWDPKAFEEKESKPPDDLLNGPNTFEKASVTHADSPKYQATPNVQAPYAHEQGTNESFDYSQQNSRSSFGTGNYASTNTGGIQTSSSASPADARASGTGPERMEVRHSFPKDGNDNLYDRKNWNMEFTDATAAAQAAAESAERASMAARAAAELSRQERKSGQYSTDSQKSSYREQEPRNGASDSPTEHYSRGSYNNSFSDKKPKVQDQQIGRSEIEEKAAERFNEDGYGRRSSRTTSLRSRNDSVHDDNSVNNEQKRYSQESSFQEKFDKAEKVTTSSPEMSIRERTRRASNTELDNRLHDSFKSDNYRYRGEEMNRNQSRTSSSRSHTMNLSDENKVPESDRLKIGNDSAENRSVVDHGNIYKETTKTSMYDDAADDVTSDESESDEDVPRFDSGLQFDEVDAKSFFPSPGRESPIHSFDRTNTLSPSRTMVDSVEKSGFDDEDEPDHKKMNEQRLYLESPKKGKSRLELTDLLEVKPSLYSPMEEEKRLEPRKSSNFSLRVEFQDDTQVPQSSDSESGQELNYGTLPGDFQNESYRRPPYTRNPSGNSPSLSNKSPKRSQTAESMPTPIIKTSINSRESRAEHKESSVSQTVSGSDFNYSSFKSTQEETKKSRFEPPPRFFDNDDDDSDDDISKGNSISKVHLGTVLSRRTNAAPTSGTSTSLKSQVKLENKPVNSASVAGRKPSRHSYSDETPPEPRSHASKFKRETSKPIPEPKISRREESFKSQTADKPSSGQSYVDLQTHSASLRHEATRAKPEPKSSKREESLKSQAAEQPPSPQRKRAESSVPKLEKASSSGGGTSTEENTVKRPSHVHPKLPDYEDIAARLQALRMNR